jgi:hypothetical protein
MADVVKKDGEVVLARRAALKKLGLFGLAAYAAPSMMNLSDAEAAGRSRSRSGSGNRRRKRRNKKRNRSRSRSRSRSRG